MPYRWGLTEQYLGCLIVRTTSEKGKRYTFRQEVVAKNLHVEREKELPRETYKLERPQSAYLPVSVLILGRYLLIVPVGAVLYSDRGLP